MAYSCRCTANVGTRRMSMLASSSGRLGATSRLPELPPGLLPGRSAGRRHAVVHALRVVVLRLGLEDALGVFVEVAFTAHSAEVVGGALVFGRGGRRLRVDVHVA